MNRLVLVVDDDVDLREALQGVLEDAGYEVATACDGEDAMSYLRTSRRPHLILLDLSMPVMDGATFRVAQLADGELAAIPTVVFSATAQLSEKVQGLQLAAYLKKPVNLTELLATVQRFCAA